MSANDNYGMTPSEASGKICPILPGLGWYVGSTAGELGRASSITISSQGPSFCRSNGCAMWTWIAGSIERGYCGLRGHVVIP